MEREEMKIKGATGAEAVLRLLSSMGVRQIFASPGSEWAPIWEALANPGLKDKPMYLSARHEEIAVGMASGYAKSTGKLPAVMVHTRWGRCMRAWRCGERCTRMFRWWS